MENLEERLDQADKVVSPLRRLYINNFTFYYLRSHGLIVNRKWRTHYIGIEDFLKNGEFYFD